MIEPDRPCADYCVPDTVVGRNGRLPRSEIFAKGEASGAQPAPRGAGLSTDVSRATSFSRSESELERETGFEPATSTLARSRSTK